MGTHPIFESDFDCLTERELQRMVEEGEIEDGEVPEEEGELRDSESDEDKTEKRKAGSPVMDPTQQKRQKIEDDEAEEGELSSEDGEINSPEPMDYSTAQDISDADLAALGGEMLTDKTTKKIDWASILPAPEQSPVHPHEDQINPENILRNANLGYYKNFLIRNQTLKAQLETILSQSKSTSESKVTPRHQKSSLGNILKSNRIRFGMDEKIPIRPFMPPNVINGELSHKITQFILKKT